MKTFLGVATVSLAMILAVACGRREDGTRVGQASTMSASLGGSARASCDMTATAGSCNEYAAEKPTSFALEKSLCEGFKGKFAMTPCPSSAQIGSCKLTGGEVKRYYGAYTLDEAKADCESESVQGKFDRS